MSDLISRLSLKQSIVLSMILADQKTLEQIIDEEPAIDAVPVVRCKDCKWQGDDEHCPVCNSCGRGSLPSGDWFCADGERKES